MQKIILSSSYMPNAISNPMNISAFFDKVNTKLLFGGLLLASAIIYLIISATRSNIQYYLTVEELKADPTVYFGQDVRVSGVVLGDSIEYDPKDLYLRFTIANVPSEAEQIEALGGMAAILKRAGAHPELPRLEVIYYGVRPDLLKNEAHAVISGRLEQDGTFTANELLLKCPSKYEAAESAIASD